MIYNSLYSYINKLLNPYQPGFQKGDSCASQLLKITHDTFKNLNSEPPLNTRGIFLDMSKTFGKVCHESLLHKLKAHSVQGKLYNRFANYLQDRKRRTFINGQESGWKKMYSAGPK